MSEPAALVSIDHRGVATVTLNRPHRNNAYDGALIGALHDILDQAERATDLRAVVVRGAGRHFQAGADLEWLLSVRDSGPLGNYDTSRDTARAVDRLNHLPVPTIALVHGACVGGGTGLLAACDIVLATAAATFAISEVRWGLTAAIIVPQLVDAIGVRQLRRYALTGETFDAETARAIGLVHEIVDDQAALDARGAAIVGALLANGPDAIAETKRCVLSESHGDMSAQHLHQLIAAHGQKRQSDEAREGLASFREKRPAAWTQRS
ncbi:MAG: enoyl-CoA hydratase/isomerase family protein [Hyphomicrobiaceae bacterium]